MEMEEDMEIEVFEAHEVDLDYEFDAARYFDFTRAESGTEARGAELWFESATTYPPSPFVAKMVMGEDFLKENVNISPKSKIVENSGFLLNNAPNVGAGLGSLFSNINRDFIGKGGGIFTNLWSGKLQKDNNQAQNVMTGITYQMTDNSNFNASNKPNVKFFFPRSSTLMKPTASQLAKQNQSHKSSAPRFQTPFSQNNQKSSCSSSVVESQAAKRQKLDGGHLRKLADVKQQTNLVHKVPRKDVPLDGNFTHARLRLTIPREPDLGTTQRAQRARPNNNTEVEEVRAATRRFKARPLNRKILEAPSLPLPKKSTPRLPEFQVFNLKTSERAMQHKSAASVPSSSLHWNDSEKGLGLDKASTAAANVNKRPNTTDDAKQDASDNMHNFKARPLNKKILSSKGDVGVFRNIKRETTVPMEFNFHSQKKIQHNPPIDLFSKLSLTSGFQPNKESQLKLHQSSFIKGPKENRFQSFQQDHTTAHLVKEKCSVIGGKQIQRRGDVTEGGSHLSTRNLGIR